MEEDQGLEDTSTIHNVEQDRVDIKKMQQFLSGDADDSEEGSTDDDDDDNPFYLQDFKQVIVQADDQLRENVVGTDEGANFFGPPSAGGSSYQNYVTSPSASFHSPPHDFTDDGSDESGMDIDEETTHGSQQVTVRDLYRLNAAYQKKIESTLEYLEMKLAENLKEQEFLKDQLDDKASKFKGKKDKNLEMLAQWGNQLYGTPYFKDRNFMPAPTDPELNDVMGAKVQHLTFQKYHPWTKKESESLEDVIYTTVVKKRTEELIEERDQIREEIRSNQDRFTEYQLAEFGRRMDGLATELKDLNKMKRYGLFGPKDTEHDWESISKRFEIGSLNKSEITYPKRSPDEVRLHWQLCRHPDYQRVGTKPTNAEEKKIKAMLSDPLTDKNDLERICKHFPNRSEFWVFREFRRFEVLSQSVTLTEKEVALFNQIVEANQGKYFYDVAQTCLKYFPNLSYHQLNAKYNQLSNIVPNAKNQVRRYFSRHEDAIIVKAFESGMKASDIVRMMPHRKVNAIITRYRLLKETGMAKEDTLGSWNKREDKGLMKCYRRFKTKGWEWIQVNFFPERTTVECQRRMTFLQYHSTYLKREKLRDDPVCADLTGKFRSIATNAIQTLRNQHYMKNFNRKKDVRFRTRREAKQQLRLFVRPYLVKPGRGRSAGRNPAVHLNSVQARNEAVILFSHLKLLKASLPKLISRYNEDPEVLKAEPCTNDTSEVFTPESVKSHLVHLLATGEFANEENAKTPVPLPEAQLEEDHPAEKLYLPPTSQSLLLLRSLLLHREHLILKCAKNPPSGEQKPTVTTSTTADSSADRSQNSEPQASTSQVPSCSSHYGSTEAGKLLFERMSSILYWPALLASKPPPPDLQTAAERVTTQPSADSDSCQMEMPYTLGRRGGLVNMKQKMNKRELKRFRSDHMKKVLSEINPPKEEAPAPKPKRPYNKTGLHKRELKVVGSIPRHTRRSAESTSEVLRSIESTSEVLRSASNPTVDVLPEIETVAEVPPEMELSAEDLPEME